MAAFPPPTHTPPLSFILIHAAVRLQLAVSWFAVGCYYLMIADFENARRYFSKATTIDMRFSPAWVGYGHAFAAQDESDQAMAVRSLQPCFQGLPCSPLVLDLALHALDLDPPLTAFV